MITIHDDVKELLEELNQLGVAIIFGGYFRSMYFNQTPNDVDIVTNIPIDVLEQKYGHLEKAKKRVSSSGYDIFSFKMHRKEKIFVEIVSTKEDLFNKAHHADFTINSLLYDGIKIIDLKNAFGDIRNKIIREVDIEIIKKDLNDRPYLWLKTLRLLATTGFDLSLRTYDVLLQRRDVVDHISNEIMQTEGHKTMNGRNPFKAMKVLSEIGFISDFEVSDKFVEEDVSIQPQQRLCMLAILSNKQVVDDFANFYCFQTDLIEKYEKLYSIYMSKERPPSRFKNQIITIKKLVGEY